MALLQYAAPWTFQPQEAVEVRRDILTPEWAWLGSNPDVDIASGLPWSRGSGLTDDLHDFGRGVVSSSGSTGFTRTNGRTTAQRRYTYIGVIRRTENFPWAYNSLFISSGTNAGISIAADALGGNYGLVKRGVVAVGASMALPAHETVVMVMSHDEDTGEYYMLVRPLAGGAVSRVSATNTGKSSAGNGTYKTGRGWDNAFAGSIGLSYLAWEFLPESQAYAALDNPWGFVFAPQSIWVPVSAGGATNLIASDATHAHTLDAVALTTSTALTVQDMAHGHALDAATLSTGTALAVADSAHAHSLDGVTLSTTGAVSLTVADSLHTHTMDAPGLTSQTDLAAADMAHGHTLDAETLTLGGINLVPAELLHAHALDAGVLTLDTYLTVADLLHAHTIDNVLVSIPGGTLDLILKILVNRQELNPATGTFTLYDNDGTTVLYTTSAWADAAGTVPYSGGALRRIDALF